VCRLFLLRQLHGQCRQPSDGSRAGDVSPMLTNRMGTSHHLSFGRRSVTLSRLCMDDGQKWGDFYIRRRKESEAWEAADNTGFMFRFGFRLRRESRKTQPRFSGPGTLSLRDLRQTDRSVVGVCGLTLFSKTLQEVSANSPVRLIVRHSVRGNRVPKRRVLLWSLRSATAAAYPTRVRARAICGPAVRKTMLSPPSRSGQCVARSELPTDCSFELNLPGAPALKASAR